LEAYSRPGGSSFRAHPPQLTRRAVAGTARRLCQVSNSALRADRLESTTGDEEGAKGRARASQRAACSVAEGRPPLRGAQQQSGARAGARAARGRPSPQPTAATSRCAGPERHPTSGRGRCWRQAAPPPSPPTHLRHGAPEGLRARWEGAGRGDWSKQEPVKRVRAAATMPAGRLLATQRCPRRRRATHAQRTTRARSCLVSAGLAVSDRAVAVGRLGAARHWRRRREAGRARRVAGCRARGGRGCQRGGLARRTK
jgi:hypothetical protein